MEVLSSKCVGTHSGQFHADEVLGCVMLTKYTAEFKNAQIVRTRDLERLAKLDIVIDVGQIFDKATYRFDHHQREFQDTFDENHSIRLSSAGLVYKYFGKEVVQNLIKFYVDKYKLDVEVNDKTVDVVYYRLYDTFIEGIDGADNGVSRYPSDVKPKYSDHTNIQSRIARLNPSWVESDIQPDDRFKEAMEVMDEELNWQVQGIVVNWLPGKAYVEKAISERFTVHPSGAILKFDTPCAWKDHLFTIEKQQNIEGQVKLVIFEDKGSKSWRVQSVPLDPGSFINRNPLKEEWRGLSEEKTAEVSGIPDVIFVHASGFIGGAKSYESTLKMAALSLVA